MPSGIYKGNKGRIAWNKGMKGFLVGKKNGFFGKFHSKETIEKNRIFNLGKKQSKETIEKRVSKFRDKMHWNWKGDKVGYRGLHSWVENQLGKPIKCEFCNEIGTGHKIHWANKSRQYKREKGDWIRLCAKCHKQYDKAGNQVVII